MRKHIGKILIALCIAFGGWVILAPFAANFLIVERPLDRADAILVLGGSSTYIERTQKAAEVFKSGKADKVLISDDGGYGGWDRNEKRNLRFYELTQRSLISQGIPADRIEVLPGQVTGTIWEAKELKKIAADRGYKSVLLVTSAYHSRRSIWTFEHILAEEQIKFGIEIADTGIQTPEPFVWWLKIRGWQIVAAEYVKFVYYWLFY